MTVPTTTAAAPDTTTTATSPEKDKDKDKNNRALSNKKLGRRGDPRMHRAVEARRQNPQLTLWQALQQGGFCYPLGEHNPQAMDEECVTLLQRKNQLSRRLRRFRNTNSNHSKSKDTSLPTTRDPTTAPPFTTTTSTAAAVEQEQPVLCTTNNNSGSGGTSTSSTAGGISRVADAAAAESSSLSTSRNTTALKVVEDGGNSQHEEENHLNEEKKPPAPLLQQPQAITTMISRPQLPPPILVVTPPCSCCEDDPSKEQSRISNKRTWREAMMVFHKSFNNHPQLVCQQKEQVSTTAAAAAAAAFTGVMNGGENRAQPKDGTMERIPKQLLDGGGENGDSPSSTPAATCSTAGTSDVGGSSAINLLSAAPKAGGNHATTTVDKDAKASARNMVETGTVWQCPSKKKVRLNEPSGGVSQTSWQPIFPRTTTQEPASSCSSRPPLPIFTNNLTRHDPMWHTASMLATSGYGQEGACYLIPPLILPQKAHHYNCKEGSLPPLQQEQQQKQLLSPSEMTTALTESERRLLVPSTTPVAIVSPPGTNTAATDDSITRHQRLPTPHHEQHAANKPAGEQHTIQNMTTGPKNAASVDHPQQDDLPISRLALKSLANTAKNNGLSLEELALQLTSNPRAISHILYEGEEIAHLGRNSACVNSEQREKDRKQTLALRLHALETPKLYTTSMLLAGYDSDCVQEGQQSYLEFATEAWRSEGRRLQQAWACFEKSSEVGRTCSVTPKDAATKSQASSPAGDAHFAECHDDRNLGSKHGRHDSSRPVSDDDDGSEQEQREAHGFLRGKDDPSPVLGKQRPSQENRTDANKSGHLAASALPRGSDHVPLDEQQQSTQAYAFAANAAASGVDRQILEGLCGRRAILHHPDDGAAHIDFVVGDKVECYRAVLEQGENGLSWPYCCDEADCPMVGGFASGGAAKKAGATTKNHNKMSTTAGLLDHDGSLPSSPKSPFLDIQLPQQECPSLAAAPTMQPPPPPENVKIFDFGEIDWNSKEWIADFDDSLLGLFKLGETDPSKE